MCNLNKSAQHIKNKFISIYDNNGTMRSALNFLVFLFIVCIHASEAYASSNPCDEVTFDPTEIEVRHSVEPIEHDFSLNWKELKDFKREHQRKHSGGAQATRKEKYRLSSIMGLTLGSNALEFIVFSSFKEVEDGYCPYV